MTAKTTNHIDPSFLLSPLAGRTTNLRFDGPIEWNGMESDRLENDSPIQTALDNESPKRGKRKEEANDREVTAGDEKKERKD